ncbi:unnamed protein product, partial [Urochloa humidicola]
LLFSTQTKDGDGQPTAEPLTSVQPPAEQLPPAASSPPYIPPDLIPDIAKRLTSLPDFFALRAACRAYRAALTLSPSNLASHMPLLVLATNPPAEQAALLHPPLHHLLRFRLPARPGTRFLSFPLGACRVAIRDCTSNPKDLELRIVHLLTGEQTRLSSPRVNSSEVLLSGDLVVTWSIMGHTIQCCHLDAANWSVASISDRYCLEGMIFVSGTLYALVTPHFHDDDQDYRLAVVQLSDNSKLAQLVFIGEVLNAQTLHLPDDTSLYLYLAECRGELILISTAEIDARVCHVFQ